MAVAALAVLTELSLTAPTVAARDALTLPDLTIVVPADLISIGVDVATGHRELRFTHRTENAGTGPFELDPTYDVATGIATFAQALYNSPSPGVWQYDHSVPLAQTGTFEPPDDYNFPLTRFTLNQANADGSPGPVVATSPKTDYCMTGDYRVGDVPNTPDVTSPAQGNCEDPTLPLGWAVGWADQYDQTDAGQPIDLSGIPDGTYVLRATVDPLHVLTESDNTNDESDTTLTISGSTVTVAGAPGPPGPPSPPSPTPLPSPTPQPSPTVVPPEVTVTMPTDGARVSGTVQLAATASATAPADVSSVQFLLDGQPLGGPVTAAPYTYSWTVGSTRPGVHTISARVTDSAGVSGTASVVTVTVTGGGTTSALHATKLVNRRGRGSLTTAAFSVPRGALVLALVGSDGPRSAGTQRVTVTGRGLTWRRLSRANAQYGDSELWAAKATKALSSLVVSSVQARKYFDQQLTVIVFSGAAGVGARGAASAGAGLPQVTMTAKAAGSLSYAVGEDWQHARHHVPGPGQAALREWSNTGSAATFWTQRTTAGTSKAGARIRLDNTSPSGDGWNFAAVEVMPADATPPTVSVINPVAGQTVSGAQPIAAAANDDAAVTSVQFRLDGRPLGAPVTAPPYSMLWHTASVGLGAHTLTATARDSAGNVSTSAPVSVTVQNPPEPMTCFVLQAQSTAHGMDTVSVPSFATAAPGEMLVAFVAADGPPSARAQSATVSGAGLSWHLAVRSNGEYGDAEVWTATVPAVMGAVSVTSTLTVPGYREDLTVAAFEGTSGTGAVERASSSSGALSVSLTTSTAASLVVAVGNDWSQGVGRTLPLGDVMLEQWVDDGAGDTYWSEYTNQTTGPAGSVVTIGASTPAPGRGNLAAVELVNSG